VRRGPRILRVPVSDDDRRPRRAGAGADYGSGPRLRPRLTTHAHNPCRLRSRSGSASCSIAGAGYSDDSMYAMLSLVPFTRLQHLEVSLTLVGRPPRPRSALPGRGTRPGGALSAPRPDRRRPPPASRPRRPRHADPDASNSTPAQLPEVWLALADTCAKSTSLRSLKLGSCGIGQLGERRGPGPALAGDA
jgi:hypothetical protein